MDNLCVIGHRKITISQLIRQCRSAVNLHVCTYIVRTTPVVYSGSTEQNMLLRNWFGIGLTGIMETRKWYNKRQPDYSKYSSYLFQCFLKFLYLT